MADAAVLIRTTNLAGDAIRCGQGQGRPTAWKSVKLFTKINWWESNLPMIWILRNYEHR